MSKPRDDRPRNDRSNKRPRNGGPGRRPVTRGQDTDWSEKPDWGGVARRGAARVDPRRGRTSGIRPPKSREESEERPAPREPEVPEREEWILESVEVEASHAVRRGAQRPPKRDGGTRKPRSRGGPKPMTEGLFDGLGSTRRIEVLQERLAEASRAFARERYGDALKVLRPLVQDAPGVAEVRELAGLTNYRLGRWKDAVKELKAFTELTGSTEQHPVLADCSRAMGRHREVRMYWDALRQAAPSADLVAEGRIVMAGSLADQDRLDEAVALMESGRRRVKKPKERHLRSAYVLADLHERAGDLPAARSGFSWLAQHDPEFGDVSDRLAALH